jgi:hypothetical protein
VSMPETFKVFHSQTGSERFSADRQSGFPAVQRGVPVTALSPDQF